MLSPPSSGSLALAPNGTFIYTPDPGFTGTDTFTYSASDGTLSGSATVTISISNVAPVATDDSASVSHDRTLNVPAPGVLANDTDANGDSLTAVLETGPAHGSLTLDPDGSYQYVPVAGYVGPDSFTYRADDGALTSAPATVSLSITNAAPVAVDDSTTAAKNVAKSVGAPGVLSNDVDADGDVLVTSVLTQPADGSVVMAANGSYTFTPSPGFVGTTTFTYSASDGLTTEFGDGHGRGLELRAGRRR